MEKASAFAADPRTLMERLWELETPQLTSTIWETAPEGEDKGGIPEIADYSIFSGSAVFMMFMRSGENLLCCP